MPPLHLAHDLIGKSVRSDTALSFRQHQLPSQMQHEVAEFLTDGVGISTRDGMVQLEDLLDQIRAERCTGLRVVPGTALSKVGDQVHHPPQRRLALHRFSRRKYDSRHRDDRPAS